MAKTKLEKIANIEDEIKQLNAQKTRLKQQYNVQERKARNHRLCKRGGLWESLAPDTITLTDEQFKTFLQKTIITEYAKKILSELRTQDTATTAPKPAVTAQSNATDESEDEGNGARVTG